MYFYGILPFSETTKASRSKNWYRANSFPRKTNLLHSFPKPNIVIIRLTRPRYIHSRYYHLSRNTTQEFGFPNALRVAKIMTNSFPVEEEKKNDAQTLPRRGESNCVGSGMLFETCWVGMKASYPGADVVHLEIELCSELDAAGNLSDG